MSALVQIMAWCPTGDEFHPMLSSACIYLHMPRLKVISVCASGFNPVFGGVLFYFAVLPVV